MLEGSFIDLSRLFRDGEQTVLRANELRTRRVVLLNGELIQNQRSGSRGVSALVCRNGSRGFASTGSVSAVEAERVLRSAAENAAFLSRNAPRDLPKLPACPKRRIDAKREIIDTPQRTLIDGVRALDAFVAGLPGLVSRRVFYYEDSQEKWICTSDACDGHVTIPRCYFYVEMNAEAKDGSTVSIMQAYGGLGGFTEQFADLSRLYDGIRTQHGWLMDKREGVYAQAGLKTVVMGGDLTGMLAHEAVGHTTEADLVLGGSVAGPNLNKPVASPLISLVDYAHTVSGGEAPLPLLLDDEGIPAEDAWIIRDGILTGYMNNRESAARFGVTPAGNARAWDYSDEPLVRMRNTAILPGRDKLSDMIASLDDGYYLLVTGNGQADATGEFMFGINMGYEVKNGKLGRAILDTTVSGVAFEMLKTVDMVSDELVWTSNGFCGKKQPMPVGCGGPALRCRMTIGGR